MEPPGALSAARALPAEPEVAPTPAEAPPAPAEQPAAEPSTTQQEIAAAPKAEAPQAAEPRALTEPQALPPGDADSERAALRAAAEASAVGKARAEQEAAAAKRAARFEAQQRAAAEQRIAELEAAARRSAALRRRDGAAAPLAASPEPLPPAALPNEPTPEPRATLEAPIAPAPPEPVAETAPAAAPPVPPAPAAPPAVIPGPSAKRWEPEPAASNDRADSAAEALIAASDFHRLQALAKDRSVPRSGSFTRFSVGDLIGVHADGVDSVSQTVRVSQQGMIELPLVGVVPAAGRTEAELVGDLESRLAAYVAKPRVQLLRPGAQPSQVTVTGAVARPGTHPLGSTRTTVLEVLAEAGGITDSAGPVVELTPAGSGSPLVQSVDPILIRLADIARVNEGQAADVYLESGDHLHVPEGGAYSVEGWVMREGIFEVTRRTTITSAIFAAGGSKFPADLDDVEVERTSENGQRVASTVDVEAILDGTAPDVPLRPGDTVHVSSSILLVPPWALYKVANFSFWAITFPFWHPFTIPG